MSPSRSPAKPEARNGKFQAIKNHPKVVYTTLLIIDFILDFPWCPGRDLNPHSANAEGF